MNRKNFFKTLLGVTVGIAVGQKLLAEETKQGTFTASHDPATGVICIYKNGQYDKSLNCRYYPLTYDACIRIQTMTERMEKVFIQGLK